MKLTILGAPGAGKGTQAPKLAEYYNIAHISTGDLLRRYIEISSEAHIQSLDDLMRKGDLVPDGIIYELLMKRLASDDCAGGYILDGFPRNLEQAEMFEKNGGKFDAVVSIHVSDELIIERISGRWSCPICGKAYHIRYNPPKAAGTCDGCAGILTQRTDDNSLTVANRLEIYHNVTKPIIDFYKTRGYLLEIPGEGPVDEIFAVIIKSLNDINGACHGNSN